MATNIRAKLSEKNKYWIDKHRHYELKHFCLQYPSWKKAYSDLTDMSISLSKIERMSSTNIPGDPTAKCAMRKAYYADRINLVEQTAKQADDELYMYLLKGVTEELSYTYLKSQLNIPCGKDLYYDRYRRFFWLLDNSRK
jgi:hypothetical protein